MSFIFLRFLTKPPCGGLKYKIRKNKNNRKFQHIGAIPFGIKTLPLCAYNYSGLNVGPNQSTQ